MDRPVVGAMERTGATVGATAVRQELGVDGSGVGVAVIDSGVSPSHDDLADPAAGGQRVDRFVDLVNGQSTPYDDYGHGTHVAGIIGGNGFDSGGARSGIAPGARLTVLKVLDAIRTRTDQRRDRGARLRRGEQGRAEHPRREPLGRDRRLRIVQHRSADARRQARGRRRASSSSPPRETTAAVRRDRRSTAASPRPAMPRGC